jgi:hypothetical protein
MTAPRTRLRWRLPDVWAMALTVVVIVAGLAAASAIYGGPA